MGALPKQKPSKGRKHRRRSHHALRAANLVECPSCHNMHLPHHVCPFCGVYRGEVVVEVEGEA